MKKQNKKSLNMRAWWLVANLSSIILVGGFSFLFGYDQEVGTGAILVLIASTIALLAEELDRKECNEKGIPFKLKQ